MRSPGNSIIAVRRDDFQVLRHAEICQFDRFSSEINFKRVHSCNYGIPKLGSS